MAHRLFTTTLLFGAAVCGWHFARRLDREVRPTVRREAEALNRWEDEGGANVAGPATAAAAATTNNGA